MLRVAQDKYSRPTTVASEKKSLLQQIDDLKENIARFQADIRDVAERMLQRNEQAKALEEAKAVADHRLPHESDREYLIRVCLN